MAFVTVPTSPVSPEGSSVLGDGWWPDVDCTTLRAALRLGDSITHARLVASLEGALITIDAELACWRAEQEEDGITSLALVEPTRLINGQVRALVLFNRAVRFAAAAELAELHRDMSATAHGAARTDDDQLTAGDYRRLSTQAVRDLIGTSRSTVSLI